MSYHEEEEQQQCAYAHHDAEGIKVYGDIRHKLSTILYVAISEVRHVVLQLLCKLRQTTVVSILCLQLAVFGKCGNSPASTLHLLLGRQYASAVGTCISIEQVVYARHITVERLCGKQRQSLRKGYAQRSLTTLGIVGLRERIDGSYHGESLTITAIIKTFHGCKFHWLQFSHLHCR